MKLIEDASTLLGQVTAPPDVLSFLQKALSQAREDDYRPPGIKKVAMLTPEKANIVIFKNFVSAGTGPEELLEVLGELALAKAGPEGKEIWERKLVFSDGRVGDEYTAKLASGNFSTHRSLVESFVGAVERLEAAHIANALIANGVSIGDSKNVRVKEWPATKDMSTGATPYSLVPLVSAYCDPDVWRYFPKAFAAYVSGKLTCGRSDVLTAFRLNINYVLECV